MERKFRVVSSREARTQEEANELILKLAGLGVNSRIIVDEEISELLPLDEAQVAALGTINFLEFSELMSQLGVNESKAKQLWGNIYHWTDLVSTSETPFYEVDTEAILAKANPTSRASRKHFKNSAWWAEHIAKTSLELAPVVEQIRSGKLMEEIGIGPVTVDALTMLINLRSQQLSQVELPAKQ